MYYDSGTPSKNWRRRRRNGGSPCSPASALLAAAVLLGIFSLYIVGTSMHSLRHLGAGTLPGETAATHACHDTSAECPRWAADGQCKYNAGFMFSTCAASCGGCLKRYLHGKEVRRAVLLRPGVAMPTVGFGTAGLAEDTKKVVEAALTAGYRKIDTAGARDWYREDLVGAAIAASGIPRRQLFITSKVHPRDLGPTATPAAVARSLKDLGTKHLDLVLLHYPECWGDLCGGKKPEGTWREAWAALEALYTKGVVRCIGVSNFSVDQLAELLAVARVKPCLVQSNSEPLRPARALQAFCRRHGVRFEGYSTLGGQYIAEGRNPVLQNEIVAELAAAKGRAPAQIVLRWALQQGQTVVPKTSSAKHMRENLELFDFDLTDEEMGRLEALAPEETG